MSDNASLRDDFRKDGYDREEVYFYRLNRELIEKKNPRLQLVQSISENPGSRDPQEESSGWIASLLNRLERKFRVREKTPGLF